MTIIGSNIYYTSKLAADSKMQKEQQMRFGLNGGTIAVMNKRYFEQQKQKEQTSAAQTNPYQSLPQRIFINGPKTENHPLLLKNTLVACHKF